MKKMYWAWVFIWGVWSVPVQAATTSTTFIISADVLASSSVGITVNSIDTGSNVWTKVNSTNLSFGSLVLIPSAGIYLPNHFFVIDAAPTGAVNDMQMTYAYQEGSNPNGAGHGLGWKSTATFVKTTGSGNTTTDQILTGHGKKLLKDVVNETITSNETQGGWWRCYLGIVAKDPAANPPDPIQAEPFTASDKPGSYNGQLVVTATVL